MKILSLLIPVIFVLVVSCNNANSFEKDTRKLARYMCQLQTLKAKESDEATDAEIQKLENKTRKLEETMRERYKDLDSNLEKRVLTLRIINEVMEDCK